MSAREPDPDRDQAVSRRDLGAAVAFHHRLRLHPAASLVLALLCGVAAWLLITGRFGSSSVRVSDGLRTWGGALLWVAAGLYFFLCAVLAWRKPR